jgi:hypothetical protein
MKFSVRSERVWDAMITRKQGEKKKKKKKERKSLKPGCKDWH